MTPTNEPRARKPIRLWPGVVAVMALWLARFGVKAFIPGFAGFSRGMMWAFGGVFGVIVWWTLFSRAPWSERLGGIVLMIVGLGGTWLLRHESMGPLWLIGYVLPVVCLALVVGVAAGRRLTDGARRATIAATILLACGAWTLVRMEGVSGDHDAQFRWRWTQTSEERIKAQASNEVVAPPTSAPATKLPEQGVPEAPAAVKPQPTAASAAVTAVRPRASGDSREPKGLP